MNDLVEYKKVIDYEIIDSINYEVINVIDYETIEKQIKEEIRVKTEKDTNNILSIFSLVWGIISSITMLLGYCNPYIAILVVVFSGLESLAGIILGVMAIKKGANKTMAILGIIASVIGIILGLFLIFVYLVIILVAIEQNA